MKNKLLILLAFFSIGLMSCDLGDDPDPGGTATQALAGEYFVQLFSAPGGDLYVDYTMWTISNTAANTADKVRISDNEGVWNFSSVFNANVSDRTFFGDSAENSFYSGPATGEPDTYPVLEIGSFDFVSSDFPQYMTFTGGGIFLGEATVPSGTVADSVAFYATGIYAAKKFEVVAYALDTTSIDPLVVDTSNVFSFVKDTLLADGPYFMSGYRRTGFLEDEH